MNETTITPYAPDAGPPVQYYRRGKSRGSRIIGASINAVLSGQIPPRPLTHDLMIDMLKTFGAVVQRILIVKDYYTVELKAECTFLLMTVFPGNPGNKTCL